MSWVSIALIIYGGSLVLLGALYKIQSWENPSMLPWDMLTIGLATTAVGLIAYFAASAAQQPPAAEKERLELQDLPEEKSEAVLKPSQKDGDLYV